jgi:hypothetical protein
VNQLGAVPALKEIKMYCSNGKSFPFLGGLATLRRRAKYHHFRLSQCINDPIFEEVGRQWITGGVVDPLEFLERSDQLVDTIDPELAAMMQALRSQFDIFAQIINTEILDSKIDFHKNSFKDITMHLEEYPTLKKTINSIKGNQNFVYLDDFVNTNKHILVPRISWSSSGKELRLMDGTSINEFERKKDKTVSSKKIIWVSEKLKPWVDECMKSLTVSLKESQIQKLNTFGEEWQYFD